MYCIYNLIEYFFFMAQYIMVNRVLKIINYKKRTLKFIRYKIYGALNEPTLLIIMESGNLDVDGLIC